MRVQLRLRLVLVVVMSMAALVASTSSAEAIRGQTYRDQTTFYTNLLRPASISNVYTDRCLQNWAQSWANHLAANRRLFHRTSGSLSYIMKACQMNAIGENLALGYADGKAVVNAWANSSGHRRNLLDSRFRRTGVGVTYVSGRWYVVQLLARPK